MVLAIYTSIVILLSLAEVLLFSYDKKLSGDEGNTTKPRIPELLLMSLSCFGGAPGAWASMKVMRHKSDRTNKRYFRTLILFNLALQVVLFVGLLTFHILQVFEVIA